MLWRVYVVLVLVVGIAAAILIKVMMIQLVEGEKWRAAARDDNRVAIREIAAERGSILADDGALLATSVPVFDIFFDTRAAGLTATVFEQNIDSLAYMLSQHIDDSYTYGGYRQKLIEARINGQRYLPIKKRVSYDEMEFMSTFPIFNRGQNGGGFIARRNATRERPFRMLAHRTIGYRRDSVRMVGIEGAFDEYLKGEKGSQKMQLIAGKTWIPIDDLTQIEPREGLDVRTTIDVNLQDISQTALLRAMRTHNADWGTAIVMEVATGQIKAIVNLGKTETGYWERYNHAIGTKIEPGSVFKLATMMALMEDDYITPDDLIDLEGGKTQFYGEEMVDAVNHGLDTTTIGRAFEVSSNVGMAKLVQQHYGRTDRAEKFIARLKSFGIDLPTGIEILGEQKPYLKAAYSDADQWTGTTLPWMSIGYELEMTPLQTLMFYNAVANDGKMMKPYLVTGIEEYGSTVLEFSPIVVDEQIASAQTLDRAQELLQRVVQVGTASKLQSSYFDFAGKTGTSQVNYSRTERDGTFGYRASFAGYFPARSPKYSCIVVVSNPRENGFYGGQVAGPVFREIAEKAYLRRAALHEPLNARPAAALQDRQLPDYSIGETEDIAYLLSSLDLDYADRTDHAEWTVTRATGDTLALQPRAVRPNVVPSVIGMGLRDALYVLENNGLKVESVKGVGKVTKQSIMPGTKIQGQTIQLVLEP